MRVKGKCKAPKTGQIITRIDGRLRRLLDERLKETRRSLSAEVEMALEAHLGLEDGRARKGGSRR